MDPNSTLRKMLEHMAAGELEETLGALDDLRAWLMGGGFLPEDEAIGLVGARGEDDPDSRCVVCGDPYARVRRQQDWEALDERMQVDLVGEGPGFVFPSPVCGECWCPK